MGNNFKKVDRITKRDVDFAQWYTDVCLQAQLSDYGQVKGMMIFKPHGYALWENIQRYVDQEFKKVDVTNVYFPLLIPASLLKKEAEHVEGFAPEVATVTKVGDKKLEEDLYIRPTSEVLMCSYFAKEVKSYRDLPLLYNQWCNVLRWEKTTRPFLRSSEFLWQEGHTMHADAGEARAFTLKILEIYDSLARDVLAIPMIKGRKTEKEKFAGAQETYTIETLMHDGQALQCGTSHYFGQNFSTAFDIKFENNQQKQEFCYSTSWGISTRLIGAIIMVHGDDNGLVLPFPIAPVQIEIVLVRNDDNLLACAQELKTQLGAQYRVHIDKTDKSFGYKMAEAEIKGTPFRIEIGPRDFAEGKVTISRRDTFEKIVVSLEEVAPTIAKLIPDYQNVLYTRAQENLNSRIERANTIEEYRQILAGGNKLVLVPFCTRIECEDQVKNQTATNSRCMPFSHANEPVDAQCFNCDQPATAWVYFARAY